MFFRISYLILPVTNLERATQLWKDVVGFAEARCGEGSVDIDSGNVLLRLILVNSVESTVSVRLNVGNVDQAYLSMLDAGASPRYVPRKTQELEEIVCLSDPDGHSIVLWRTLTEDDWGFVPEIPKQEGEWTAEAEDLLKRLLLARTCAVSHVVAA